MAHYDNPKKKFTERNLHYRTKRDERKRREHHFLYKLAHSLITDLDPRFVYDRNGVPPEIDRKMQLWLSDNSKRPCHVIAYGDMDGKTMTFAQAENSFELSHGAIIILSPGKLAYYRTEQNNIQKAKHYLLSHP